MIWPPLPNEGNHASICWTLLAEVRMGQHDPLGDARRPARVLVHGDIVEAAFDRRRIGGIFGQAVLPGIDIRGRGHLGEGILLEPFSQNALDGGQVVADAGGDDLFDLRLGTQRDHPFGQDIERDQ